MAEKTPKGRGRGHGKTVNNSPPPKSPDIEVISQLSESKDLTPEPEQFSDADPSKQEEKPVSTTTGDGKTPPLAHELKESMKGLKIVTNSQSSPFPAYGDTAKAPLFSVSLLNGPSSGLYHDSEPRLLPVMTKQMPLSNTALNIHASEFVPRSSSAVANGIEPVTEPDDSPSFGLTDIIQGFTPIGDVENLHSEPIIKAAAEMLIKGTMYVVSFDHLKSKLVTSISNSPPSDAVYTNLAEMLIHWGVVEAYFRPTSCKICEAVNEIDSKFRKPALGRLFEWYNKETSDEEKFDIYRVVNFALFFSELFVRLRIDEKPIEIISGSVIKLVNTLIKVKTNDTLIGACNILKLTGALLQDCDKEEQMPKVIELLKNVIPDSSLSRSCIELITRVIEMNSRNWKEFVGVSKLTALPGALQPPPYKEEKGRLNIDAAPFVPTVPFQIQQPVTNIAEWNEFETDYNETDSPNMYDFPNDEDCDDLDPDIELDMEAFITEIEEHLLMQEYDPELENM